MSDEVKAIVEQLNKPPFSLGLTLIGFDAKAGMDLLQTFSNVCTTITGQDSIDLRGEQPENTISRLLSFLRSIKYRPPENMAQNFRSELLMGSKEVIYAALGWMLPRLNEIKTRAYLARFLTLVEVPPEVQQSDQVVDMHDKYLELVEEFKAWHKDVETYRNSGFSTIEIKKDITHMEEEIDQLKRRIERLQKKAQGMTNSMEILTACRTLRAEHEREATIHEQTQSQILLKEQCDEKIQHLQEALRQAKAASVAGGVDGLMHRVKEEEKMNQYLTTSKLPNTINERLKLSTELERIVNEPALTEADLDTIRDQIAQANEECNRLVEKKMLLMNSGNEDKLAMFRKQATIITKKKEATAEKLQSLQEEVASLESEAAKRKETRGPLSVRMPKPDEFKMYVAKLRTKSTTYKQKKAELAELQAEYLVLSRTEKLIEGRSQAAASSLNDLEAKKGVQGYTHAQDRLEKISAMKSELDEQKGKKLEDISTMVIQLHKKIADKKTALSPLIKDLRNLRTSAQELEAEYEEKKAKYDSTAAGLESNKTKLEQEVRVLVEELGHEEGRFHYLSTMMSLLEAQKIRAQEERQLYLSHDAEKRKSLREQFQKKVQEQESQGKVLREKQKVVKDSHEANLHQQQMSKDLLRLLECKLSIQSNSSQLKSTKKSPFEEDRLVL